MYIIQVLSCRHLLNSSLDAVLAQHARKTIGAPLCRVLDAHMARVPIQVRVGLRLYLARRSSLGRKGVSCKRGHALSLVRLKVILRAFKMGIVACEPKFDLVLPGLGVSHVACLG